MNLIVVGQLVSQHAGESTSKVSQGKSEQEVVRCMFNWIWRGMIVLGLGVVLLVGAKSTLALHWFTPYIIAWLKMISGLFILGGAGMAAFGVLNSIRQGVALSAGQPSTAIAEPVTTKELPTTSNPPTLPSVTERTTQLIPAEVARTTKDSLQ